MKIDLNLFTVFEAIYTEGSLTRAAERLNLTQPAISHALSRLRDKVDDPLFIRNGHKMQPTAAAQNLFPEVQQALGQLNQALQKAHKFEPATADKTFKIAMGDLIEATLLVPLVNKLEQSAPNLQIASVALDRKDVDVKLAGGELDFVVDILRPNKDTIHQTKLVEDELVVLINKNHYLKPTLSEQDYMSAKHILVSSRPSGPSLVDYAMSSLGVNRNIGLRCQHYFSACQVTNESNFMLTIPKRYAMVLCSKFNNIELRDMPFTTADIDLYLYWHHNHDENPGNQWLRTILRSEMGEKLIDVESD
jgi:DNA-binding transcriptional LysR family regulator